MNLLKQSTKKAVVYKDKEYSFNEVLYYSEQYAKLFRTIAEPTKVIIFSENCPEWIFAFFGVIRNKAIVIPVDVQSSAKELAYIINDCCPELIFTSPEKKALVEEAIATAESSCKVCTSEDFHISTYTNQEVTEIKKGNDEDTVFIIYTSGTTGSPKGVMLSYKNVFFNIDAVSKQVSIFTEDRRTMILLPLHHAFPLIGSLVAPLCQGETVYIAEGLNAESILGTLNRGKINIFIGVPRLYEILAKGIMTKINASAITRGLYAFAKKLHSKSFSRIIFSSVHKKFGGHMTYLVCGGAALPTDVATVFDTLGFDILEGYGMTETAPMISFTRPNNIRLGYAGEPLPNIEVKIDEKGEVCVKGPNVMQGYYNRPEETADIIKDGWLHTGDIGEFDGKSLKLTGRIKHIIVTSNGKNINPEEVENDILKDAKYIKEIGVFLHESVLQCIVVPQTSNMQETTEEYMNEVIKEEITNYNQSVSSYKRIKQIHLYMDELPKTRLMKIQRFKLPSLISAKTTKEESQKVENETQDEVFTMLKSYVDSENGCNAKRNDDLEIDLAIDSLSRVAFLTYIEKSFGVLLKESQFMKLNTLGKLSDYIKEHVSGSINTISAATQKISWKEILTANVPISIPKPGFIQALCSETSKVLMHLVYRYKKHETDKLPNKPCIIVANHRSALDGYFISSKLKRKISKNTFFFAKEKHFNSKIGHFFARKNNVILMDINTNVRESLQQMAQVLKAGKNIIIFPEGTRAKDNKLLAFKDSFAILSRELDVPVVPVAINGSERAIFNHIYLPRPLAKITVDFLSPIYPNQATIEEIKNDAMTRIANKLKEYKKIAA